MRTPLTVDLPVTCNYATPVVLYNLYQLASSCFRLASPHPDAPPPPPSPLYPFLAVAPCCTLNLSISCVQASPASPITPEGIPHKPLAASPDSSSETFAQARETSAVNIAAAPALSEALSDGSGGGSPGSLNIPVCSLPNRLNLLRS